MKTYDGYTRFPDVDLTQGETLPALHRTWTAALWEQIELVRADPRCAALDAPRIARVAWAETAARHPRLRTLLDEHGHRLPIAVHRAEDLLLATGLGILPGVRATGEYAVA